MLKCKTGSLIKYLAVKYLIKWLLKKDLSATYMCNTFRHINQSPYLVGVHRIYFRLHGIMSLLIIDINYQFFVGFKIFIWREVNFISTLINRSHNLLDGFEILVNLRSSVFTFSWICSSIQAIIDNGLDISLSSNFYLLYSSLRIFFFKNIAYFETNTLCSSVW